jgi:hypothetical protein
VVDSCPTEVADTGPEAPVDRSRSPVQPVVTRQVGRDGFHVVRHTSLLPAAPPAPHVVKR